MTGQRALYNMKSKDLKIFYYNFLEKVSNKSTYEEALDNYFSIMLYGEFNKKIDKNIKMNISFGIYLEPSNPKDPFSACKKKVRTVECFVEKTNRMFLIITSRENKRDYFRVKDLGDLTKNQQSFLLSGLLDNIIKDIISTINDCDNYIIRFDSSMEKISKDEIKSLPKKDQEIYIMSKIYLHIIRNVGEISPEAKSLPKKDQEIYIMSKIYLHIIRNVGEISPEAKFITKKNIQDILNFIEKQNKKGALL